MCCLVLRSNFALLLTIQFATIFFFFINFFFFFFFFLAKFFLFIYFLFFAEIWGGGLRFFFFLLRFFFIYFIFFFFFSFFLYFFFNFFWQIFYFFYLFIYLFIFLAERFPPPPPHFVWAIRYFLSFCHDFFRAISLEPLLAETPNRVCCLVLRSNFALLLTIQFASLISSLIIVISLLLTMLEFFIFGGSLLGRIQGD